MKKIILLCFVCVTLFAKAQYSPQSFNVSGPCTLSYSYSSGQYHYKRTPLDTIFADGHELLVIDDSTTTTTVTVHFPTQVAATGQTILPYPGQLFSILSMDTIPTVALVATPASIQGTALTTLAPNTIASWVYVYSARSKAYVWLRNK